MDFFGKIFEKMNQIDKLRIKEQFALKNLITSNADKIQQLEEDTQAMRKRLDMQQTQMLDLNQHLKLQNERASEFQQMFLKKYTEDTQRSLDIMSKNKKGID